MCTLGHLAWRHGKVKHVKFGFPKGIATKLKGTHRNAL